MPSCVQINLYTCNALPFQWPKGYFGCMQQKVPSSGEGQVTEAASRQWLQTVLCFPGKHAIPCILTSSGLKFLNQTCTYQ